MTYNTEKLHALLKASLSDGRYCHSVSVADYARELALRFGVDSEKAYVAGLLHDCAKKYDGAGLLSLAEEAGLEVSDIEGLQPVELLHARLGAYIARRDYGITDEAVLQAIARHQSGGVGMTKLDKIIGLADSTEPGRKADYLEYIRELLKTDLDKAYLEKHTRTMIKVIEGRYFMDSANGRVYNYLIKEMKSNLNGT